jgi:hypothetical protein
MAKREPTAADAENAPVVFVPEEPEGGTKRLTVYEQVERNLRVVHRKMRGEFWEDIAKDEGITVRRCKAIMLEFRQTNPTLRHHDPVEVVDELLEGYAQDIRDLVAQYEKADTEGNRNAAVGSINSRMAARERITALLQGIGVLPQDLGTMHLVIDGRVMAEKVMSVLERFELPDDLFEELERVFDVEGTATELPALEP